MLVVSVSDTHCQCFNCKRLMNICFARYWQRRRGFPVLSFFLDVDLKSIERNASRQDLHIVFFLSKFSILRTRFLLCTIFSNECKIQQRIQFFELNTFYYPSRLRIDPIHRPNHLKQIQRSLNAWTSSTVKLVVVNRGRKQQNTLSVFQTDDSRGIFTLARVEVWHAKKPRCNPIYRRISLC